jgi:adenylate cyclase
LPSRSRYKEKKAGLRRWQAAALAVVAGLLVAAVAVGIWRFYLRPSPPPVEVASAEKMAFPLPEMPSIAVLPFINMSGDPEQEYFSDGLTEDLITDLSRFSGMFVISRNSVFLYKGRAVKPKQVSEELGVRYVLEGSVRKSGDRVRVTAQLIDATTGGHLWAERYDRDLKDIFTVQDELTQQIVSALEVKVRKVEQERAFRKHTDNLNVFDYNLRGWWYYHRFTKEANARARLMFETAIELEPEFADAYAGLGFTYYEQWARLWSQDPQSLERAFGLAKRAMVLDDSLGAAHTLMSHVCLWKNQHAQAISELERAIDLDPNDANGYADLAETLVWAGRPEEALGLIEKAMRLNPHYPVNYLFTLGFAYFLTRQYEEAIAAQKRALARSPDHLGIHLVLATIYSELGREEEARAHVAEALRTNPQLSLEVLRQRVPFKDTAPSERISDALRKAGLK